MTNGSSAMRSQGGDFDVGSVPMNWSVVTFSQAREWLQYGTSVHCTVEPRRFPVLRIPNVESGRVNAVDVKYCDLTEEEARKHQLENGDLLFVRTNGVLERLGSCAVYVGEPQQALFASYLIRARLKNGVDPHFVAYFYASPLGSALVSSRATPAADGKFNLNTGTIDSLPLCLPPTLNEQRAVVTALDRVRGSMRVHDASTGVARELKRKVLSELFARGLRGETQKETEIGLIPESWLLVPTAELFQLTSGETRPAGTVRLRSQAHPYPVIGGNGVMGFSDQWNVDEPSLMVIGRVGAYCGAIHVVSGKAWITDNALYVREWKNPSITVGYVSKFLDFYDLNRFKRFAGQPLVTQSMLYEHKVPMPATASERADIVAILDTIDRKIDLHKRKRAVLDELFKSLLHKLMTGEIAVADLDLSALAPARAEVELETKG